MDPIPFDLSALYKVPIRKGLQLQKGRSRAEKDTSYVDISHGLHTVIIQKVSPPAQTRKKKKCTDICLTTLLPWTHGLSNQKRIWPQKSVWDLHFSDICIVQHVLPTTTLTQTPTEPHFSTNIT